MTIPEEARTLQRAVKISLYLLSFGLGGIGIWLIYSGTTAGVYLTLTVNRIKLGVAAAFISVAIVLLLLRRTLRKLYVRINKKHVPIAEQPIGPQCQEALNTVLPKLTSLSKEEWETLENIEAAGRSGIWDEQLHIDMWRSYIDDARVLEREGLVRKERNRWHLTEDIWELKRKCGYRKLRDLLNRK
jgi:hypothetical protein